uniref:Protein kinase domain-containing protein n=1 Tax=Macrostomum lignano TaxID=282301 RepID=A0A1I8HN43_9PLAT
MDKDLIGDKNLIKVYREIEAMKCLRHPYIIRLYEVIETASQVCLVMEFASKGEVFGELPFLRISLLGTIFIVNLYCHLNWGHETTSHVSNTYLRPKPERYSGKQSAQCLTAITGVLLIEILKAENLLLDYRGCVKLVDFGFCNVMQPNELLNTHCGSPQYASPELFKGEAYDGIKVDVWVAIKIMDKDLIGDKNLIKVYREIEAMKCLRHPYIIRLYEVIETASQVCLVMEFASKGEVFDYITRVKHLPETEAREIFWQTVCAVSYCHHRRIAHRDLKAENLLLDYRGCVKLVDFGFCNVMQPNELLNTHCGSPQYASPELFKGEAYDGIKVDVWSLGVILYVLVCGSFPFCGEHLGTIKASVMRGLVRFPFYLSHSCESLIRWMLNSDPVKRCSIEQVCCSPWMRSSPNWPAYAELMQHYASTKPAAAAPEAEELDPAVLSLLSDNFGYDAS